MRAIALCALVSTACGGKVSDDPVGTAISCSPVVDDMSAWPQCPTIVPAARTARAAYEVFAPDVRANIPDAKVALIMGTAAADGTGSWTIVACSNEGVMILRSSDSACTEVHDCGDA